MKKIKIIILMCLLVLPISGCEFINDRKEVSTTGGKIRGIDEAGVQVYYSIPYAEAPVGKLRWKYPKDVEKWKGVRDCTENNNIAIQKATTFLPSGEKKQEIKGTEDCLNLDIYTKNSFKNKPVLVYLHGGNNQSGNSKEIDGNKIVKTNDVVYVSVNYRLGLLGFNCLPALTSNQSGNFGLMDIKKSLEWIKDNIKQFGGNPNNVILSGFSAGGRDVMATLISKQFEGLYQKAIVYSGGMTTANLEKSRKITAKLLAPLVVKDKKMKNKKEAIKWLLQDKKEVKDYLYSISAKELANLMNDAEIRMNKFPHLFEDGITIPKNGFKEAKYIQDVPIIMITGTDEFSLFAMNDKNYQNLHNKLKGKEFAIKYGSELYRNFNTQYSASSMLHSGYKSNIYLAQINYGGRFSKEDKIKNIGSFHGIFVPMLTYNHNYSNFFNFKNSNYQKLADDFNLCIKEFCYKGNFDNNKVYWKKYNKNKTTLVLDVKNKSVIKENENVLNTEKQIFNDILKDKSIDKHDKEIIIKKVLNGRWFSENLDKSNLI